MLATALLAVCFAAPIDDADQAAMNAYESQIQAQAAYDVSQQMYLDHILGGNPQIPEVGAAMSAGREDQTSGDSDLQAADVYYQAGDFASAIADYELAEQHYINAWVHFVDAEFILWLWEP
jgi:hypothetical protein